MRGGGEVEATPNRLIASSLCKYASNSAFRAVNAAQRGKETRPIFFSINLPFSVEKAGR
jgi:hypothetical protein